MPEQIHAALKQYFGYEKFRPQQQEIIEHTLRNEDSLIVMPTGGGKSICYQIPAIVSQGTALVISPLIALMQDQVEALRANGVEAAALNSSTTLNEIREIQQKLADRSLKMLYVSPERAVTEKFIRFAKSHPISLVAIDEAHCVSVWGNDFRPEYTRLPELMQYFEQIPFMALTATADKTTQMDIIEKLKLRSPKKFLSSFERKNLKIGVVPAQNRMQYIVNYVKSRQEESGIIYCLSRKSTEKVAAKLQAVGIAADFYHAELGAQQRMQVQRAFQRDELKVICATIAFGMGIDKPNIRFVLHHNLPKNIESYYQEIGRAGRDGLPAETLLFFSMGDGQILREFIEQSNADDTFKQVQRSKLARMIDFGTATSCRTNLILSYFGEHRTQNCGHCDNCLSPPRYFDGTILAQKALSAAYRMRGQASINLLVDVLRGSEKKEVLQRGYQHIKTFGVGKDISRTDWLGYVSQLVNQGYFEVDFTDFNKLKVTEIGQKVLFEKQQVKLTQPEQLEATGFSREKPKTELLEEGLLKALKALRLQLAKAEEVPAYVIFSDKTLQEMARKKPQYLTELSEVSGVGERKLNAYGERFLEAIKAYLLEQQEVKNVKGRTYLQTLKMFREGNSPEQIAQKREIALQTVYNHFAYLYEKGEAVPITDFIGTAAIDEIGKSWVKLQRPEGLKPLFDALNGRYEYHQLRLAVAFLKRSDS